MLIHGNEKKNKKLLSDKLPKVFKIFKLAIIINLYIDGKLVFLEIMESSK